VISVQDSGTGVPADLRERIWEPFFTTRQRGTGLGLAIVRKRVQEIGGSATLEMGQNGHGALFQLRVPLWAREGFHAKAQRESQVQPLRL
jgi:signal transduction histidine kinase